MATYVKVEKGAATNKDWKKLVREISYDENTQETTTAQKELTGGGTVRCGKAIIDAGNHEEEYVKTALEEGWVVCNQAEWDELNCDEEDTEWAEYNQ